ncbi:MAG TPA: hypothetical protein VMD79_08205 [Solirubrobacteraceae bacterium]|nr:hypothetical protein [Solirubrobacteraceae bacterium]
MRIGATSASAVASSDSFSPGAVPVDDTPAAELSELSSEGFGASVAISGSTLVAGAPTEDDAEGAAYTFTGSGKSWFKQAELTAGAGSVLGGVFGRAVAISGDTMVVGAPGDNGRPAGRAFVLTYSEAEGSWSEPVELAPGETGQESNFGYSVAISGSTVVVGAPGENGDPAGKAYVFTGSGASWSKPTELPGPFENRDFGASVATSGSTVVVGDPTDDDGEGVAYTFTSSGKSWSQQAELTAANGAELDRFGAAVAISGSTLLVGAPGRAQEAGAAYVFVESAGSWSEKAELTASEGAEGDRLGEAVTLSETGATAILGAPGRDDEAGAADVFTSSGGSWSEQAELTAPTSVSGALFGAALSISGSTLAVAGPRTHTDTGTAYVFELAPAPPSPELSMTASATPNPVAVGQNLENAFTITNTGSATAEALVFSDELPTGVTLELVRPPAGATCKETGGAKAMASCTLGSLEPGKSVTVEVIIRSTFVGPLANTATVASTTDPSLKKSATAEATVELSLPPPSATCEGSMPAGVVTVLADCISELSNGTYLAEGNTRFSDGARIVLTGTQNPAPLIIDPAKNTITIAPASGGGAQTGELEVAGVDVASGQFAVEAEGQQDPVSGVAGAAKLTSLESVALSLSGWTFETIGVKPTAYLLPSSAGGGAIVDGRLTLPYYLGTLLDFGSLSSIFSGGVTGQLAVQVAASGAVSVHNGGISVHEVGLPYTPFAIKQARLEYTAAGDRWTGNGTLVTPEIANLLLNPVVISDGKLDELIARFQCGKFCSGGSEPTIGVIIEVKDVNLEIINLQGLNYTPPGGALGEGGLFVSEFTPIYVCHPLPTLHLACPALTPPPPPPQIDGEIVIGVLGGKIIAGGGFKYLLNGDFVANGEIAMAPLYGGHFPIPTSTHGLEDTLSSAKYGINIATGTISFEPPHTLIASGTVLLPPLPSPQFLKGTVSIGIDPPHFTAEGSLDLIVPYGAPILGGDDLGGVTALISDEAAAGEVHAEVCAPKWLFGGGCIRESLVIAYVYASNSFKFNLGGNVSEYATVAQAASAAKAGADTRTLHVPAGKRSASFTIRSAHGTPNVELISPSVNGHRLVLTLADARRRGNHSGGLATVAPVAHQESFLVATPPGGSWTVSRLKGPKILSARVSVPRHGAHASARPRVLARAGDLPRGTVSTSATVTLRYSVPSAPAGTTVQLWAGTRDHGAGGVLIAENLPASGSVEWKLSGLGSGRYWPYAIVTEHGIPVAIDYWPGSVDVADPAAPASPSGVSAYANSSGAEVIWNQVAGAIAYTITASPAGSQAAGGGGGPIVDAVPATQLEGALELPRGEWTITVQAVGAQDTAGLPSAPTSVSVP